VPFFSKCKPRSDAGSGFILKGHLCFDEKTAPDCAFEGEDAMGLLLRDLKMKIDGTGRNLPGDASLVSQWRDDA